MKCSVEGCNGIAVSKGMCWPCYQREYKRARALKTKIEKAIKLLEEHGYSVKNTH